MLRLALLACCFTLTIACADSPVSERRVPLGLNLAGVVDWSSEHPFVDGFRTARPWISQQEGQPWGKGPPLDLTAEGWVKQLKPGQYATTLMLVAGGHQPGTYVCLYEGEGTLEFSGNGKVSTQQPGRIEVKVNSEPNLMVHLKKTKAADPLRNIRFLMPGCEATYQQELFSPSFAKRTGQFSVIRFMDWMNTNNSKIRSWEDRPKISDATQAGKGVALEHMIALCNQLKVDPWFCMPHLANDDYVRQFAEQVKATLGRDRKVYLEYSNEVWNGQFEQARHAKEQGMKLGLSKNEYQAQLFFHSQRSVEIFTIWEKVFNDKTRLLRVLGSQSANPWVSEQVMQFHDAYRHADAVAIAPYFGNELGDPQMAEKNAKLSVDEVLDHCSQAIEKNQKIVREVAGKAKKLGLQLITYEGGQHLVGYGGAENHEALTKLLQAANRHPRMKELYLKDLKQWQQAGGGLFTIFSSVSQPSKWGSWGMLEAENQDIATAPKYQAVLEFLRR